MRTLSTSRAVSVLVIVGALIVSACSSSSSTSSASAIQAPTESASAAATAAPSESASVAPSAPITASAVPSLPTDGTGLKIGYISGGDSDPFVIIVTKSVLAAAKKANVDISECDSQFDAAKALACAQTLSAKKLDAMINWQFFPDSSKAICDAYGNLPTVAMDTPETPCQKTFVGADNHQAGIVGGTGLGTFAKTKFNCQYDAYISLDIPQIADINKARAGGSKEGFESVCGPIPASKYFSIDTQAGGPDQSENSRRQVTDLLTRLPNAKTILLISPSGDPMAVAALNAADVVGRKSQMWVTALGADPSAWKLIAHDPQWVGDTAFFPEKYGDLAVPAAIALARGQNVPANLLMTHVFIDASNIQQYYSVP